MPKRFAPIFLGIALTASPLSAATSNAVPAATPESKPKSSLLRHIWPFHSEHHAKKTETLTTPKIATKKISKTSDTLANSSTNSSGTEIIKVVPTKEVKRSQELMNAVRAREKLSAKTAANHEVKKSPAREKSRRSENPAPPNSESASEVAKHEAAAHEKNSAKTKSGNGFSAPISFIPDSANVPESPKMDSTFGSKLVADATKDHDRYEALKAKALSDEKIQKLKDNADNALSSEESLSATKAYYHALFSKIHHLNDQSSFDSYIDRMQAALEKRLSAKSL